MLKKETNMKLYLAEKYALDKMTEYGLITGKTRKEKKIVKTDNGYDVKEVVESLDWKFKFDKATSRFGQCNYSCKTISLSKKLTLLNSEEEVKDVVLHEIAHALTRGAGHGKAWKEKCVEIGARPERCYDASKVETPKGKYIIRCTDCGNEYHQLRWSKFVARYKNYGCGKCHNRNLERIK